MKILYTESGILIPDSRAYETMKRLCDCGEDVAVGSDCLLVALRLLIAEGEVDCQSVTIQFGDHAFQFDEFGHLEPYVEGFMDSALHMMLRLLQAQAVKRKKKDMKSEERRRLQKGEVVNE